jgi:hypothetical protein
MSSLSISFVLVYLCCTTTGSHFTSSRAGEMLGIAIQRPDDSLCVKVCYRLGLFQPYRGTFINNLCQHHHLLHCNSGDKWQAYSGDNGDDYIGTFESQVTAHTHIKSSDKTVSPKEFFVSKLNAMMNAKVL